jgi:hypothetical protein
MDELHYLALCSHIGDRAGGLSETLVPLILSLPVALFACGGYFYLRHQAATVDFEMRTTRLRILNDLARLCQ